MELSELNQIINTTVRMSLQDRQKVLRWLAHQNDLIIYEVLKHKKSHFHRLKNEGRYADPVLIDVLALYLAVKETISQLKVTNRKNRSGNFGFLRIIGDTRAKQLRKPRFNAKREKLLNLQGVIKNLIKEKNYSYREVAKYLKTYHRFDVSHTAIRVFYLKMKDS